MKTFVTSGLGSQQSIENIQDEKIPVYDTLSDAQSDLANLAEGQIIATRDYGTPIPVISVVDTVADGNMNAVTSNAVYDAIQNIIPIGLILPFGGNSIPVGYLLCDGSAVSRTTYAKLFAVIGTAFGTGDGSTTFNIPDMREATAKGAGLTGKSNNHLDADGLAVGEFIDDRIQDHTHDFGSGEGGQGSSVRESGNNQGSYTHTTQTNSGRTGATTEVKAVGCNWIIKVK